MIRRTVLLAAVLLVGASSYGATKSRAPSDPVLVKETIVGVLSAARSCGGIDQLQQSVQPLLFLLERSKEPAADQALIDLSWYRLGEANLEIYMCILLRRGPAIIRRLRTAKNDCAAQLGGGAAVCVSKTERAEILREMAARVEQREPCELEY